MFHSDISRRQIISAAASALLTPTLRSGAATRTPFLALIGQPNSAVAHAESGVLPLSRAGQSWQAQDVRLGISPERDGFSVTLQAPLASVMRIHLRWQLAPPANLAYLGDHWERSYGDLAWRTIDPERVMPWYFLASDSGSTFACGVKTAPAAFCFWQVDPGGVSLWLDVRNGGRGLKLGTRELSVATVIADHSPDTKPFAAATRFCRRMSPNPRMPAAPVYGGNNWYYAYGKSSAQAIRDDSERIASLAGSNANRPFMVIDDGWQPNSTAGPWQPNEHFGDMAQLAAQMKRIGVQPGIWIRPTFTKEVIPESWRLVSPNAAREYAQHNEYTLDPTVPEALERMQHDIRTLISWGYPLIKHDFSTYDLLGRWGFAMGAALTDSNWNFADRTRTNAEIIRDHYAALRVAAGNALLLGCNTVGHLAAGLFELQRIGDDTSGRDWNRTRKMGVNTLAFRAPQHGSFFAIDADCVGLTKQVPWNYNRQWLDLLARSGTPLFVSAAPEAVGPEQRAALIDAFAAASKPAPLGEPLDWLRNPEPQNWMLGGKSTRYDWFGADGASPFSQ